MTDIGKRIKELRQEKGVTMDILVEDIKESFDVKKLDKSMISRWERGENEPSLENAKYLCMYFDVSLDYLIGLTDVRTPSRLLTKRLTAYYKGINGDKK